MLLAVSVAAASPAHAKVPSDPPAVAPPGITVTGTGLASVEPPRRLTEASIDRALALARRPAISRALNDARGRATAIAIAAGVTLGPASSATEESGQPFAPPATPGEHCRRSRRSRREVCRVPPFVAVRVTVNYATSGAAEDAERVVTGRGSARSPVQPDDRNSNSAIREAVIEARGQAAPLAFAAARDGAAELARSTHATLGPLVGVAEDTSPFFFADIGPFGPGRYCGTVRRPIFERVPGSRRRRVVRRVRRRICGVPRFAQAALLATYAVTPAPQRQGTAADPTGVPR
jgi:uncharacterized protein YggE